MVLSAHCSLRKALPMQAKWEFPTQVEEERTSSSSSRGCSSKKKKGEEEFWRWDGMRDEGGERMGWRQHVEDERRRWEEEAKRRRSEGGRSRAGREGGRGGGKGGSVGGQEGGERERKSISEGGKEMDEVCRVLSSTSHQQLLKVCQGATAEEVSNSFLLLLLFSLIQFKPLRKVTHFFVVLCP